jgi:hypothetical protein
MKLLVSALLLFSSSVPAATYYVRTDGGTPTQCTGAVNAAYSSARLVDRACAISNPMYVLPPKIDGGDTNNKPLIAGGDTLMIGAGQYQIGEPFGTGIWDSCKVSNPWDCMMQPVPSGTAAAPTKIIGAGSTLTQFYGSGGASAVVNLTGSNYVLVQGIEITDHSNCIKNHRNAAIACASGLWASTGITNTDGRASNIPSNDVTLTDLNIHGLAKFGVQIGNVSNLTVTNVKIIANGFGGWSTDLDPARSESNGVNTFTNDEIAFNGCTENYPSTTIYGCWSQEVGGYGDGFGSASSSHPGAPWITDTVLATDGDKGTWTFTNLRIHDNMQDGLDFLHADKAAVINVIGANAYNNVGNQLKVSGVATIKNSVVVGNCGMYAGVGNMAGNNSNGGNTSTDICRAQGDAVVVSQSPGVTTTVDHNTIISEGNTVVTVPSSSFGDNTSVLNITNNVMLGSPRWIQNDGSKPAIWWWGDGTPVNTPKLANNVIWNLNSGPCQSGNICADPKLANASLAAFDPTPLVGSPLIGKASDGTNIGAIQSAAPTQVACTGGVVANSACYCAAGTTAIAGVCSAIPKACAARPPTCTTSQSGAQSVTTCVSVCQ